MEEDDENPFSSDSYDLCAEVSPEVDSLRVEVKIADMVGDTLGEYTYDEESLPSHIECDSCGHRIRFGWAIEEAINNEEEEIDEYVSCSGEMRDGRECLYGLDIEGSVSYE